MKKRLIILSAIIIILILGVGGFWAFKTGKLAGLADVFNPEKKEQAQTAQVGMVMTVKDSQNIPVSGALVRVCNYFSTNPSVPDCTSGIMNGLTNSNGQYAVGWTDPLCTSPSSILGFAVNVEKYGFCPLPTAFQNVTKTNYCSRINYLNFILNSSTSCGTGSNICRVSGTVYDATTADNLPIADAIVTVKGPGGNTITSTRTNTEGQYALNANLTDVDNKIMAAKTGYQTVIHSLNCTNGTALVSFAMKSPPPPPDKFDFIAKVRDTNGQMIENVRVTFKTNHSSTIYSANSTASSIDITRYGSQINLAIRNIPSTDDVGYYTVHIEATNPNYQNYASDSGFYRRDLYFSEQAQAYIYQREIVLAKRNTFKLEGTVKNSENGQPLNDVLVRASLANFPSVFFTATTGPNPELGSSETPNGFYSIDLPIYEGVNYYISVVEPGYRAYSASFSFSTSVSRIEKNIDLIPKGGRYVSGKVFDSFSGKPIKDARISIIINDTLLDKSAVTDDLGFYLIEDLPPATMIVRALHPNYMDNANSRKLIKLEGEGKKNVDFSLNEFGTQSFRYFDLIIESIHKIENGQEVEIPIDEKITVLVARKVKGGVVKEDTHIFNGFLDSQSYTFRSLPLGNYAVYVFLQKKIGSTFVTTGRTIVIFSQVNQEDKILNIVIPPTNFGPNQGAIDGSTNFGLNDRCLELVLGKGIFGPEGMLVSLYKNNNLVAQTRTDGLGNFMFWGIDYGIYDIKIQNQYYFGELKSISINQQRPERKVNVLLSGRNSSHIISKKYGWENTQVDFVGFGSHQYINLIPWNRELIQLERIKNNLAGVKPNIPKIVILESPNFGADMYYGCNVIVITTKFLEEILKEGGSVHSTLMHEYAHQYMDKNMSWILPQISMTKIAAEQADGCPFVRIRDANVELSFLNNGHPEANAYEYFASFFTAYFDHHDRLLDTIINNSTGECQNVLAFTWQWFSENIARLYSNDNMIFHPARGRLWRSYQPFEIRRGLWKEGEQPQSLTETAQYVVETIDTRLHFRIAYQGIKNIYQNTKSAVMGLINLLNRGEAVVETNINLEGSPQPLSQAQVFIAGRKAATNSEGIAHLTKIKPGEYEIKVIYNNINLSQIQVNKIKIEKNKTTEVSIIVE